MTNRCVFVPGILGSTLWKRPKPASSRRHQIWPVPGTQPLVDLIPGPNDDVVARAPIGLAYQAFLSEARSFEPMAFDWRQPIARSSVRIAERLLEVLSDRAAAPKIDIVTHSMGGVVLLHALHHIERHGSKEERASLDNIAKIVSCCTPYLGSLVPLDAVVSTGSGSSNPRKNPLFELAKKFGCTIGGTRAQSVLLSWHGLQDLLLAPNAVLAQQGFSSAFEEPSVDPYALTQPNPFALSKEGMARIERHHEATIEAAASFLDRFKRRFFSLATSGGDTHRTVQSYGGKPLFKQRAGGNGDGTVPTCSSVMPGMPKNSFLALDVDDVGLGDGPHPWVFKSPTFRTAVFSLLNGTIPSNALRGQAAIDANEDP